jgi:hypothetical protein
MKALVESVLFACVCVGLLLAFPPRAHSKEPCVADTLKQLEQDLGEALESIDADRLNQILADDWSMLGYAGKISTKQSILANLKSGRSRLKSFENGPMDVTVLDDVAVVQGISTQKSTAGGIDSSGRFMWMDVFVKRGDKWLVIRSQIGKVSSPYRPRWAA